MNALKIILSILLLSISSFVFALEAPKNIVLEKATSNSLELYWDKVEGAGVYSISYGEQTGSGSIYENDQSEIFSTNSGVINDLKSNTKYFIALKSYDENNNESEYSKEVSFSTLGKLKELKIENIDLIDTRNFKIKFNLELNKDSVVSLNIINSSDDLEDIEVQNSKIENNELKVFLTKDLKINNKYGVTIITLEGKNGEIIQTGVDGIVEFLVNENTQVYGEKIDNTELNSAGTGMTEGDKLLGGKDLGNTIEVTQKVAKEKEKLPTTGPAETFLFLLFSLIAGGLFMILRRKTSL